MSEQDVARLARALEDMRQKAPDELRELARQSAEDKLLPSISRATPKRSGRLANTTRVGTRKATGTILFFNPTPYANSIHWGRKKMKRRLPAGETYTPERRGPRGRRPASRNYRLVDSPVKANKFIYRGVDRGRAAFDRDLGDKITEFMRKEISNG